MRIFSFVTMLSFIFVLSQTTSINAQSAPPTNDNQPDFIVPARPTVSNPAEFQRPGVLQLEFGYNGNFHSQGSFNTESDFPLAIRFAVSRRILLEVDNDGPYSLSSTNGSATGDGDM